MKKGRIYRGSVNYLQKGVLLAFACHKSGCDTANYRCDKSFSEIKEFLANSSQPQSVINTASLEALEEEKQKREERSDEIQRMMSELDAPINDPINERRQVTVTSDIRQINENSRNKFKKILCKRTNRGSKTRKY